MKNIFLAIILIIGCDTYNPPFRGTIFIDKDIITNADSSTFIDVLYTGIEQRTMFDRRVDDWVIMTPYLFDASFNDGLKCEIQVNPEFGNSDNALIEALRYGEEIGRLPTALRKYVETVWIHKGIKPFGGDAVEWRSFIEAFDVTVHARMDITEIEKFFKRFFEGF